MPEKEIDNLPQTETISLLKVVASKRSRYFERNMGDLADVPGVKFLRIMVGTKADGSGANFVGIADRRPVERDVFIFDVRGERVVWLSPDVVDTVKSAFIQREEKKTGEDVLVRQDGRIVLDYDYVKGTPLRDLQEAFLVWELAEEEGVLERVEQRNLEESAQEAIAYLKKIIPQ